MSFLLVVITMVGGTWILVRTVGPFLSAQPVPVRTYPATQLEYTGILNRFQAFSTQLAAAHVATMALSARDLNTLVAFDPSMKGARGRVYFTIAGSELGIECSAPLAFGQPGRPAYYLNLKLLLTESFSGGEFTFELRKLETLSGQPTPAIVAYLVGNPSFDRSFTQSFNQEFRRGLSRNPTASQLFEHVQSIVIQNGQIFLTVADH